MWPQALQMTRDECRGILRRLELESYSQVISVFRAQGGLSDSKAKLLEELRGIFHISQERHRAEARRVANDEELATIAEAISGPNTWQEWSREGRRSFPMLPRIPPQTALALLANSVACETAAENAKLEFPANTAAAVAEEQAAFVNTAAAAGIWDAERAAYVVTSDPFKMPEIPAPGNTKKNLKRNMSDNPLGGASKKRNVGNNSEATGATSPTKQHYQQQQQHQLQQQLQQQQQKQYQHITANTNVAPQSAAPPTSNIRKLYHNHNKLQQQRFMQQQQQHQNQQQTKPKATKKNANAAAKRQATPAKSGRRAQKQQEQQKQLQQQQQQHQQQNLLLQQQQQHQQMTEQQQQQQQQLQHAQLQASARNLAYIGNPATSPPPPTSNIIAHHFDEDQLMREHAAPAAAVAMPQIAASKKDITKNLTKLQIPATVTPIVADVHANAHANTSPNAAASATITTPPPQALPLHGKATPVQKYIVEDRQPQQQQQTPQIMTLPQISAAATKLRAINTTILPPGTKLTTTATAAASATAAKKLVAAGTTEVIASGSSQSQVLSIIDGTTTITANAPQTPPAGPSHMPPAVIQLHGGAGVESVPQQQQQQQQQTPPAQGRVLTTKLMPVVLSAGGSGTSAAAGGAQITKIETLNNGATLLNVSGSGTVGATVTTNSSGTSSSCSSVSATMSGTIIKNLPSSMLLSGGAASVSSSGSGGTIISTLGAGATVFRKPPNIIKTTGIIGMGAATAKLSSTTFNAVNASNVGGPQIISNVKLTPASITSATTASGTQQQFLQHQLKNVTKTGLRTSVNICQSPNGKVFLQPAILDAASKAKFAAAGGALQHKLLAANTLIGSGGGSLGSTIAGGSTTTTPQRIAIQKVQIIPAPHAANSTGVTLQKPTTLTLSGVNKSNMIFVPASSATRVGVASPGHITLTKTCQILQAKSPLTASADASKPNVVIIGAATSLSHTPKSPREAVGTAGVTKLSPATFITDSSSSGSSSGGNNKISEMITEDTPVDILSLPIIVDDGSVSVGVGDGDRVAHTASTTLGNNIGDTVTVLASNIIETTTTTSTTSSASATGTTKQQPSTVILGATDWEMELDQATAKARNSGSTQRRSTSSSGGSGRQRRLTGSGSAGADGAIVLDDHFEDVIVVEQQEDGIDGGDNNDNDTDDAESAKQKQAQITTIASGDDIIMLDCTEKLKAPAEDDAAIEVIDEQQQQQKQSTITTAQATASNTTTILHMQQETVECETDAGFDETIDTEMDENTAIEYIEEEHSAAAVHHDEDSNGKSGADAANSNDYQHERPTSSTANAAAEAAATNISLEEDDKNNTINCRFSEIISSSGDESDANAFVFAQELEAGTLATTGAAGISSHDEQ